VGFQGRRCDEATVCSEYGNWNGTTGTSAGLASVGRSSLGKSTGWRTRTGRLAGRAPDHRMEARDLRRPGAADRFRAISSDIRIRSVLVSTATGSSTLWGWLHTSRPFDG
jgi:hypothetical protein